MPLVDAHCQHQPTDFVIVGWKVGQDEVTVWLNRISCNALFDVLFKQRQMPVGQTVTQALGVGRRRLPQARGFCECCA